MNVWNLFFTILIIFTNVIKSEVITFFNLSPVHRVDNTTMNKDKFISNDIEIPVNIIILLIRRARNTRSWPEF